MLSRFFIDRPIFATVLSVIITLAGAVALTQLPLAQFPHVSPPHVSVTCTYPGASAQTVSDAVAAPIEQQVNGVEGMLYMSSSCTNDGAYTLTVTFKQSTDLNMAQVLVQNRVSLALPNMPDVIKQTGVTVRKRSPDPLCGFAIISPHGRYDQLYLSNYTLRYIREELIRVSGVSDIFILAQRDFSMRIWVNPNRLAIRGLTASDLVAVIRDQNQQVITGSIGQEPAPAGQDYALTVDALGRLDQVEQFENMILKTMPDGRIVRLKDVARVELSAKDVSVNCRWNRKAAAFVVIFQNPDANALELRGRVMAKMKELTKSFPEDVAARIAFDTTPYTAESIREVFRTLTAAIILVALVVLLFLQNWRSALIPLAAVPVAIIGTFAVMAAFGFSMNNLTLFGLVLAIGIVVDDAIVVVEAVEHHIESGLSPYKATVQAMKQVSGPVVAVGLVLSAVFIPCAFISGITGLFFRQFALTIAAGTLISTLNSLTFSPALAAMLLRPHEGKRAAPPLPGLAYLLLGGWLAFTYIVPLVSPPQPEPMNIWQAPPDQGMVEPPVQVVPGAGWLVDAAIVVAGAVLLWLLSWPINWMLRTFFWVFNGAFNFAAARYVWVVGWSLRGAIVVLVLYVGLIGLTLHRIAVTPKGFIPTQDMGYLLVSVQLPDSASLERTSEVMHDLEDIGLKIPGIRHVTTITGQSFALSASGSNFGSMFINLADYADRKAPDRYCEIVAQKIRAASQKITDAQIAVFSPPPVRGIGRAGGFSFVLEDRGDIGPQELQREVDNLILKSKSIPGLNRLFTVYRANVPQLRVEPNLKQCQTRGVAIKDFTDTLSVFEGSLYVNDFNRFGRTWEVIIQADEQFRDHPDAVKRLKVRNSDGNMVQLGTICDMVEVNGPLVLNRYNMYPAAQITGFAGTGTSSREAITKMEALAKEEMPGTMAYEWTDLSYLELAAGNTGYLLFVFAVTMVFLVLAAQYESWSLPLAVILVVPMCLLSATLGVNISGMIHRADGTTAGDINVFTQVGFVVLVGLASKNAILIVEFAKHLREQGVSRREATLAACKLRLRPIVMTSTAFILGVLPLVLSNGAGGEMRRALGVAVFAGMIGVTAFGLLLTPVFFNTIDWLSGMRMLNTPGVVLWSGRVLDWLSLGPVRRALMSGWKLALDRLNAPAGNGPSERKDDSPIDGQGD